MSDNDVSFKITAEDEATQPLEKVAGEVDKASKTIDDAGKRAKKSWEDTTAASQKFAASFAVVTAAVGALAVSSISAARDQIAVNKETESILAATGGVAGVTRGMVDQLSSSLSRSTNFTDDQVQAAENMLLTFNKLSKDVFPAAIETTLNMAQKFGGDATAAAVQLGKALQNPIVGITALTRVGVSFNDQQIKQIETLVKSNKTLEAQQIILDALNKDNGLANLAKNAADPLKQMYNQIGEIQEAIGFKLIPVVNAAATAFLDWLDAMGGADGIVNSLAKALTTLAPLLPFIAGAIAGALTPAIIKLGLSIAGVVLELAPFMAAGAALVALGTVLYGAWQFAPPLFALIAGGIAGVATAIVVLLMPALIAQAAAWWAAAVAAWAVYAPILGLIALFAAAGVAIGALAYIIYTFRDEIGAAFTDIANKVSTVWNDMMNNITTVWQATGGFIATGISIVATVFVKTLGIMWTTTKEVFTGIGEFMLGTLEFLLALFTGAGKEKMEAAWHVMMGGLGNIVIAVMNGILKTIETTINTIIDKIADMIANLAKNPAFKVMVTLTASMAHVSLPEIPSIDVGNASIGSFIGGDLAEAFSSAMDKAKGAFTGIPPAPTGPGGGGGDSGTDEEQKKKDAALKAQIEDNVRSVSTGIKQAQDDRTALQAQINKINDELARETHDGVKQNQDLLAQRTQLLAQQKAKDATITKLQAQLDRSNTDLAASEQKEIDRQKSTDNTQSQFSAIDDIISAQKQAEQDAADAKAKADAAKKKQESTVNTSTQNASTAITDAATPPSIPDITTAIQSLPGVPPSAASALGGDQAKINAGGIVLVDLNGTGDKTYNIDIHDNDFNGSGEDFAMQVGDIIVKKLGLSIASPTS